MDSNPRRPAYDQLGKPLRYVDTVIVKFWYNGIGIM